MASSSTSVRNLRVMLLGGILFTGIATGSVYIAKRRVASATKRTQVVPMDYSTRTQSNDFKMSRTEGGKTVFRATAKKAIDYRDTGKSQLEGVEIFIFGKAGDRNDKITTKNCDYDSNTGLFFAPGEVQIELGSLPGGVKDGKPTPPDPNRQPVHIATTSMTFDQKHNIATTEQDMHFEFAKGTGEAKGAVYDSTEQTFWLKSNVVIHITNGQPTEVHAAELHYFERTHEVHLVKPTVLRPGQTLASDTGVMYLDEKQQAKSALLEGNVHGVNDHESAPGKPRHTEFFAARLDLNLDEKQHIHDAVATAPGSVVRMDSRGPTGRTEAQAARLEMDYTGVDNSLKQAQWKGAAKVVISPAPTQAKAQTRTITAEHIEMNMKPGGKELANARTVTPGRVEMIGGGEPKRVLTAREIWSDFNDRNALNQMRAVGQVRTESDPPTTAPAGSPVRITTSDRLDGSFNAQQQLERMAQTGNFQYTEGDRHATAESAVYTLPPGAASGTGLTVLTGTPAADPRVWDPGGAVIAKKLTMPEKSGDTIAEGNVRATQIQAKDDKSKKSPGIFGSSSKKKDSKDAKGGDSAEPVHIVTNLLRSDRKTGLSHYEGGPNGKVRMWQGGDVIEARVIDMDKTAKKMVASGDVWSSLVQSGSPQSDAAQKDRDPLRVQSDRFNYSDIDRHAHYEGSVVMRSSDMTVTSSEVDAWLRAADEVQPGESRLERAIANGKVHLDQPALAVGDAKHKAHPARQSDSEHAIYTTDDGKILLTGGSPIVRDEVRGSTTGHELTWLTADDKIFVDGGPDARTLTLHRMVKKQP